jgi:uncharacterized protein YggU (UPF0235/DUF167 family)
MILNVLVRKGSGKPEMIGGNLVVHTTEERKNNAANRDVIRQVSQFFSVGTDQIRIVRGHTKSRKILEIYRKEDKQ